METGVSHGYRPELEKIFLSAVERGEKKTVLVALKHISYFNVNCMDAEGRTAVVIAVQNGNIDILRILLEHRTVVLGDSLLRAVDMNFTPAVKAICECLKQRGKIPNGLYCRSLNGDFHADITPVVLAAHHNSYDVLKLLLDLGARIEQPEFYNFQTEEFTLEHSVGTINVYRALASQAYISLTSEDPIQTAFHLSWKLRKLSVRDYEFRFQYEQLADQCAQYAADLLGQVRNSHEQVIVLNHNPDEWIVSGDFDEPLKVKKAIRYNQKKFIAHPHCQQRLIERWYDGLPSWRKQRPLRAVLLSVLVGFCFPLLSICYIISPHSKVSRLLKVPYVRFVCHTASSVVFLCLLTMQAVDIHGTENTVTVNGETHIASEILPDAHLNSNPSEILVMLYVLSSTVTEFKELWTKGARVVKENISWKVIDYCNLFLFWMWMALHLMASLKDFETVNVNAAGNETSVLYNGGSPNTNGSLEDIPAYRDISPFGADQSEENSTFPKAVKIYLDEAVSKILASQGDVTSNITNVLKQELAELETNIIGVIELKINEATTSQVRSRRKRAVTRISSTQIGGGRNSNEDPRDDFSTSRMRHLPSTHPLLIADGLFAIAKVLSFLRLIRMTVVHLQIGPMQISLGRMMIDISKFFGIFCLVWFAFSVGLNQLYFSYSKEAECPPDQRCGQPYGSITNALSTLFWTLFGMSDLRSLDIIGLDHWFTETVGRGLYAAYHVLAIVVLLNILIAMMSNTYTRIEEDADMQWKYSRSRLWISFYEVNSTLPPPFNLFPTVHCVKTWFTPHNKFCGGTERKKKKQNMMEKMDKEYKDVVKQLVHRYIFGMRRASGEDESASVPDPWIMQLKQDVSGFKYDMFETLGNMDSRMKRIQHTVEDTSKENTDDQQVGTEMLHVLEGAIAAAETEILPVRPQVFRNLATLDDDLQFMDLSNEDFIHETPNV
ncbi:short transient receptor potential channel 5-like [Ptychodera flava]|uniref:short transient receptor potential channel 5-like n=1 Tax=Ptychodera flava TaxID=63121 RepID=UPI00396A3BDA